MWRRCDGGRIAVILVGSVALGRSARLLFERGLGFAQLVEPGLAAPNRNDSELRSFSLGDEVSGGMTAIVASVHWSMCGQRAINPGSNRGGRSPGGHRQNPDLLT
jgi:hypothetical protein